jgi:transcriptional regulator with XRE-family HTH domain
MNIGERLKEEREKLGFDQEGFAALGGASRHSQIDWEKGKSFPNAKVLAAYAAAGADVQYILTGIPSAIALAADERLLLERYRSSSQALKDAALRVLLSGEQASATKIVTHGDAGQQLHGSQTLSNFTIDMRKNKKGKE